MLTRFYPTILLVTVCGFTGVGHSDQGAGTRGGGKAELWSLTPPRKHPLPPVKDRTWGINPIDSFVLAKLEEQGLSPSKPAGKPALLRRVTFDLIGLPPTVEEQEAFLKDASPDAYEKVVNRLLALPRHGERWAQHWLDVVRYAETDGFKADDHRPEAYRYRDYVIKAFNADLPYDRFIRQQIAGDELEPDNPDALVATGYLRLWPDEYNAANLEQRRQEILDDVTEVTGLAFLGLTLGCARCHDHKFDPVSQSDYFRLQAFFAAMQPREAPVARGPEEQKQYGEQLAAWETATAEQRKEMDELVAGKRDEMRQQALTKFRQEIQDAVLTAEVKRTPYQQQIAHMALLQIDRAESEAPGKMSADKKKRYQELEKQVAGMGRPKPPARVMAISDVGATAPPTHLLANGDWRKPREELQPGFPVVLGDSPPDTSIHSDLPSTGRRAVLARWLTRQNHPLTARVMANRLWQHHFGVGLAASPNDFGTQGDAPTHPELLDWLAVEFVENGWSLKHLHRLMVTSATYRQSSFVTPDDPRHAKALKADPDNKLLWHARRRRLEGETLRDAMLAVSGDLNPQMFGPSAKPKLPEGVSKYAWKPDAKPEDRNRRSVYVLAKRNMRFPMFDAFDLPDQHQSCGRRTQTTTAPQALLLLNGELTMEQAAAWSKKLRDAMPDGDSETLVCEAYRAAWGRVPADEEIRIALRFLEEQTERTKDGAAALTDFCHALLNANEFLYVD